MIWADRVDQWLDKNSVKGGHSSIAAPYRLFVFPLMRMCIHVLTLGISLILMRLARDNNLFYSKQIRNRTNPHQNLDDESAKNRIKRIFAEEMVQLGESEKVLFLIEDEQDKDHGMVFTNQRLVYRLLEPKLFSGPTSGQVTIEHLKKDMKATEISSTTIRIGDKAIGKLQNQRGDLIDNFLNVIRKSLQNEEMVKSQDSDLNQPVDPVNYNESKDNSSLAEETDLPEMKPDPWGTYTLLIVIWGFCFALLFEGFGLSIENSAMYGTILCIAVLGILSIVLTRAFVWYAVIVGIIATIATLLS